MFIPFVWAANVRIMRRNGRTAEGRNGGMAEEAKEAGRLLISTL